MRKIIYFIILFSIIVPIFSFAQIGVAEIQKKAPGILEGWWNSIKIFWGKVKDIFLGALKKAWEASVKIWKKMWAWFKNVWNKYIWPKLEWLWEKITSVFRRKK